MKGGYQRITHGNVFAGGDQSRWLPARDFLRKAGTAQNTRYQIRSSLPTYFMGKEAKRSMKIIFLGRFKAFTKPSNGCACSTQRLQHAAQARHRRRNHEKVLADEHAPELLRATRELQGVRQRDARQVTIVATRSRQRFRLYRIA